MNHLRNGLMTLFCACLAAVSACNGNLDENLTTGAYADPQAEAEAEAEAGTLGLPLPGPFGDQFSERVPDPAQADPTDVATSYRQHNMRSLSASYRSLELILRYDAGFEVDLYDHATALTTHAQRLAGTFELRAPAPSGQDGARDEIWQQWETFQLHADGLTRAAAALATASASADQPRDALLAMLNDARHQCLACHQRFRRR
jgi:cytochrome c556